MEMIGDPRYAKMTLTMMTVVNAGRRPITITGVGAYRLFPQKPFVIPDTRPNCPCELTEGKQMQAIIDEKGVDLSVMESWEAYTSTGGTYRLAVVPWYKRCWNRRKFREQAMAKAESSKLSQ